MLGGLPQSLSGSDTDVSTSNENLSNEERYVIRHTARQEPQGQENQQHSPSRSSSHKENIPNIQVIKLILFYSIFEYNILIMNHSKQMYILGKSFK